MKRLLKISALLVLYCLTTAKSCDSPEEEKARDQAAIFSTRDSIRSTVSSDRLSEETLRAFEESAGQKLHDFSDYAGILADSSIDRAFRNQAAGMIRELFIPDAVPRPDNYLKNPVFDSVQVLLLLHRTGANCYEGELACIRSGRTSHSNYGRAPSSSVITVDIHLIKRVTVMGKDTLNTWKVFLGKFH